MQRSALRMSPIQLGQSIAGRSGSSYLLQRLLYEREGSPYKFDKFVVKTVNKYQYDQSWEIGRELQHSRFVRKPVDGIDGEYALVFSYYTEDLLDFVKRNVASKEQIKKILFDSLQGIRDLHEQNWVHGDVKPSNILVLWRKCAGGTIEVLGSTISDIEDAAKVNPDEYINGFKPGNVYWRSPEANFGNNIDYKTDIFSFGSVVIYALSGRVIFAYDKLEQGQTPENAVITNQLSYFGHNITKGFIARFHQPVANAVVDILKRISSKGRTPFSQFLIEGLNGNDRQFIEKVMMLTPSARPEANEILKDPWWDA